MRDAWAGLLIGGSLGFFSERVRTVRDGAWLKMARAVTWGVPAAALGGALGLVAGEVVIGLLSGGLLGRACLVGRAGAGNWSGAGAGRSIAPAAGLRPDRRRPGRLRRRLSVRVAAQRVLGNRYDIGQAVGIVHRGRAGWGCAWPWSSRCCGGPGSRCRAAGRKGESTCWRTGGAALGLDERAEIGIFGDPTVARRHAEIESTAQGYILRHLRPPGRHAVKRRPGRGTEPSCRTAIGSSWDIPCWSSGSALTRV